MLIWGRQDRAWMRPDRQHGRPLRQQFYQQRQVIFGGNGAQTGQRALFLGEERDDGLSMRLIKVACEFVSKMFDIELSDEDLLVPSHSLSLARVPVPCAWLMTTSPTAVHPRDGSMSPSACRSKQNRCRVRTDRQTACRQRLRCRRAVKAPLLTSVKSSPASSRHRHAQ